MAPTNATVPVEKNVELKEETKGTVVDSTTQSSEKLLEQDTKAEVNVDEIAKEHLALGKRHLLTGELDTAIDSLAMACDMLRTHYGETAIECSEGYFYYGKALLELARMESDVLQNGLKDCPLEDEQMNEDSRIEDPEKCTDEEKQKVSEIVEEALNENFESCLSIINKKSQEKEGKKEDDSDRKEPDNATEKDNSEGTKDEKKEKSEDQQDEEMEEGGDDESKTAEEPEEMEQEIGNDTVQNDADEPSNLQCAWELLDLNRVILSNELKALEAKEDPEKEEKKKEINLKISHTLHLLAEVSLENENFSQALDDFNSCLEMRKNLLPSDSRLIAETLYQLGVAQEFHQHYDDAVGSLNSAIDVLKKRIANLSSTEGETEVKEIQALVPEIEEKIKDIKEIKEEDERNKKAKKDDNGDETNTAQGGFASEVLNSKEAAPISSNLIKKKANSEQPQQRS